MITATSSKSCQLDPLPTTVVKKCLLELLSFITDMCNASLAEVSVQLNQRHAIITPPLKKTNADPSDAMNYRTISNLTFMSKLVERLVCRQLVAHNEAPRSHSNSA